MVIPISKLMSKTNEDENVSILARVFQVIIYLFIYLVTHKTLYNMNKRWLIKLKINVTRKPNEA